MPMNVKTRKSKDNGDKTLYAMTLPIVSSHAPQAQKNDC